MKNKRALIIVTNHSDFEKPNTEPTGLWLSELTHFYDEFEKAGVPMDIVSPLGGKIPIDNRSLGKMVLDKETKKRHEDQSFMSLLENTKSISDINWQEYDIIYFAGGHGGQRHVEPRNSRRDPCQLTPRHFGCGRNIGDIGRLIELRASPTCRGWWDFLQLFSAHATQFGFEIDRAPRRKRCSDLRIGRSKNHVR